MLKDIQGFLQHCDIDFDLEFEQTNFQIFKNYVLFTK